MRKGRIALAVVAAAMVLSVGLRAPGQTGATHGSEERITGIWRGNSVCAVKDSPCRDELNVYRFSKLAGKPDAFTVTASKIVEGKEIVMGSADWSYDPVKRKLESAMPAAVLQLVLNGDKMDGTLTLRDGTVYRRIHLARSKE